MNSDKHNLNLVVPVHVLVHKQDHALFLVNGVLSALAVLKESHAAQVLAIYHQEMFADLDHKQ